MRRSRPLLAKLGWTRRGRSGRRSGAGSSICSVSARTPETMSTALLTLTTYSGPRDRCCISCVQHWCRHRSHCSSFQPIGYGGRVSADRVQRCVPSKERRYTSGLDTELSEGREFMRRDLPKSQVDQADKVRELSQEISESLTKRPDTKPQVHTARELEAHARCQV